MAHNIALEVVEILHSNVHVEGVLHLGALSTAVLLAFLGIDRLEIHDPIGKQISEFRQETFDRLVACGYVEEGSYIGPNSLGMRQDMRTLCYVSGVKGIQHPKMLSRLRLLNQRLDKVIIKTVGSLAAAAFFILVCSTMWPRFFGFATTTWFIDMSFTFFVLQLLAVGGMGFWHRRVGNWLRARREVIMDALQKQVIDVTNFGMRSQLIEQAGTPLGSSIACPAKSPTSNRAVPTDCRAVLGANGKPYTYCPTVGIKCPETA
ncbi:hypothetical protein [Azospirillum sp. B2RO_4]|uniref:hypothetical protein n=1 Tax=Azospirillum sp. B2RO_4 TaxID=3027796 RepID=UPI003DA92079